MIVKMPQDCDLDFVLTDMYTAPHHGASIQLPQLLRNNTEASYRLSLPIAHRKQNFNLQTSHLYREGMGLWSEWHYTTREIDEARVIMYSYTNPRVV